MLTFKPEFSVLVSLYAKDNLKWFKEALDSVLEQTALPAEVLIAIDGPLPLGTKQFVLDYAAKHPLVKNIFLPVNRGRGVALKEALPMCACELVALMDADDINRKTRFETLLKCFEADSDLAVLGGQVQEVDAFTLKPLKKKTVPCSDAELKEYVKMRSPINQNTVMFKKSAVIAAGSYRAYHLFEDYDLWARMAAKGLKMGNTPEVLVDMRIDEKLFKRRGGWKYFKSNFAMQKQLLNLKLIGLPVCIFNICVRFTVQVLMPNSLRKAFYNRVLR